MNVCAAGGLREAIKVHAHCCTTIMSDKETVTCHVIPPFVMLEGMQLSQEFESVSNHTNIVSSIAFY